MWTRRRTILDENDLPQDDWIIMRDGHDVGRVYWRVEGTATSRWFWASWGRAPKTGTANSLEEAQEAVRDTFKAAVTT